MRDDPWMDAMRRGDFAAAWRVSDRHLDDPRGDPGQVPRHLQRIWRGQSLAGRRVLVRCYHGLGDTLQFVRYVPLLARVAREVVLWVQPALLPLVADLPGVSRALPLHDGAPGVDFDVDVELMELPHVFRTTLATVPAQVPYLRAPALHPDDAADEARTSRSLALIWRAGAWDPARTLPVHLARAVADAWDGPVAVLQETLEPEERRWFPPPPWRSVADVAALLARAPLTVTVDTFVAHLAGALGRPAWVLLPAHADWRWLRDRADSPWYPTLRLVRQPAPGRWGPVVEQVRAQLGAAAAATAPAASSQRGAAPGE